MKQGDTTIHLGKRDSANSVRWARSRTKTTLFGNAQHLTKYVKIHPFSLRTTITQNQYFTWRNPVIAEFLRAAYRKRDQLVTVPLDIYKVKHKSKNGMKLLLCKGKNTPGRLMVQNIAKDGLKLKILRTAAAAT